MKRSGRPVCQPSSVVAGGGGAGGARRGERRRAVGGRGGSRRRRRRAARARRGARPRRLGVPGGEGGGRGGAARADAARGGARAERGGRAGAGVGAAGRMEGRHGVCARGVRWWTPTEVGRAVARWRGRGEGRRGESAGAFFRVTHGRACGAPCRLSLLPAARGRSSRVPRGGWRGGWVGGGGGGGAPEEEAEMVCQRGRSKAPKLERKKKTLSPHP